MRRTRNEHMDAISEIWPAEFPGSVFLVEVGSTAHGVGVSDQDDYDYIAVRAESPEELMGDVQRPKMVRTAKEGQRSGPNDIDLTIYPLRKFAKLVSEGNPNIITCLFTQNPIVHDRRYFDISLLRQTIDKKSAARAFLGYLHSQSSGITGKQARQHLVDKYGYDTKNAYHALRLGYQGCEFLLTGTISQPVDDMSARLLREIRLGEYPFSLIQSMIDQQETALKKQLGKLGDTGYTKPDRDYRQVLAEIYLRNWQII